MAIFKLQKNSVGAKGEKEAQKYLKKQGYKIIDRNWCNESGKRIGEIDIIAMDTAINQIVFVEVKTRKLERYDESVLPEDQITKSKLNKINKIAEVYIKENDLWSEQWRIDAISVYVVEDKVHFKHLKNIFY
jgi:putative endonuclease